VLFKTLYRVSNYKIPATLICSLLYFMVSVILLNCIYYVINTDVLWYAI